MTKIVEIKNLSKFYSGKMALDKFNYELEKGKIVGVLGPNGSGKTSLFKIIAGLLKADTGSVLIDGHEPGIYTKSIVSFLPDRNFIYTWMTIGEAMQYFIDFFPDFNKERCEELLDFMNLDKNIKVESLSKGMLEKLNLALVLSRDAKLYILDEPIGGVDLVSRAEILDAIIKYFNPESSMIISTHLVSEMESIFEDIVFIKDGALILEGNADDLREENGMKIQDLYKKHFSD